MSTQSMQQQAAEGGLDETAAGPRPQETRKQRHTYRLSFWVRIRKTKYSLTFILTFGRLREGPRRPQAFRMVGPQPVGGRMLAPPPPDPAASEGSVSGVKLAVVAAEETMTSSQDYPRPVLGIDSGQDDPDE